MIEPTQQQIEAVEDILLQAYKNGSGLTETAKAVIDVASGITIYLKAQAATIERCAHVAEAEADKWPSSPKDAFYLAAAAIRALKDKP